MKRWKRFLWFVFLSSFQRWNKRLVFYASMESAGLHSSIVSCNNSCWFGGETNLTNSFFGVYQHLHPVLEEEIAVLCRVFSAYIFCYFVIYLFYFIFLIFQGGYFVCIYTHTHTPTPKTLLRILILFLPIFCLRFVIVMIQLVVTLGSGHGKREKYFVGMFRPGHSKNRAWFIIRQSCVFSDND